MLKATATTFHLSRDPETQVATLGPDSLNPSTRPSLVPNSVSLLPSQDMRANKEVLLKDSFLTDEVFQALKSRLDVDLIENTFDTYVSMSTCTHTYVCMYVYTNTFIKSISSL